MSKVKYQILGKRHIRSLFGDNTSRCYEFESDGSILVDEEDTEFTDKISKVDSSYSIIKISIDNTNIPNDFNKKPIATLVKNTGEDTDDNAFIQKKSIVTEEGTIDDKIKKIKEGRK